MRSELLLLRFLTGALQRLPLMLARSGVGRALPVLGMVPAAPSWGCVPCIVWV